MKASQDQDNTEPISSARSSKGRTWEGRDWLAVNLLLVEMSMHKIGHAVRIPEGDISSENQVG